MKIIKLHEVDLDSLVDVLKQGQTLVYPTETTYGLGCDATNTEAVNKVFQIKKRQKDKSVLVIASHVNMMMDYVKWTPKMQELAMKYWPGPLTMVVPLKRRVELPEGVVSPDNTIAFRVTEHPLVFELTEKLGRPLVSTSANIASLESPYDIESVLAMFQDAEAQPDIIIDAGELPHHAPSTVIKVVGNFIEVLRQGEVVVN